jgi:hypothetical protein
MTTTAPATALDLVPRLDTLFREHFAETFAGEQLAELQARFQEENIVPLRGFCAPRRSRSWTSTACCGTSRWTSPTAPRVI